MLHISSERHNFKIMFHTLNRSRQYRTRNTENLEGDVKKKNQRIYFLVNRNAEGGTSMFQKGDTGGKVRSCFPVTPFNIAFIYWIINLKLWPGKAHWGYFLSERKKSATLLSAVQCHRVSALTAVGSVFLLCSSAHSLFMKTITLCMSRVNFQR